jgi:hypothetical protein
MVPRCEPGVLEKLFEIRYSGQVSGDPLDLGT